jgi:hypothetical protein
MAKKKAATKKAPKKATKGKTARRVVDAVGDIAGAYFGDAGDRMIEGDKKATLGQLKEYFEEGLGELDTLIEQVGANAKLTDPAPEGDDE